MSKSSTTGSYRRAGRMSGSLWSKLLYEKHMKRCVPPFPPFNESAKTEEAEGPPRRSEFPLRRLFYRQTEDAIRTPSAPHAPPSMPQPVSLLL